MSLILMMGAPGVGKGTQTKRLTKKYQWESLSTGDALRAQIKKNTEIGQKAQSYMNSGALVPDKTLLEVLKSELNPQASMTILDGYPRNLAQAKTLETMQTEFPLKAVIHLELNDQTILKRIAERRQIENRPDDTPEKAQHRLTVYKEQTSPLVDYYRDSGFYHLVDGTGDMDTVTTRLTQLIEKLKLG